MTRPPAPARKALVGALVVAGMAFVAVAPASAATSDGFWYFDALNVGAAHEAGWTGEGVTIAVMDTPVNMDVPTLVGANVEVREPSYCQAADGSGPMSATSTELSGQASATHGTNVLSMISGTGDGYPGQAGVRGVAPDANVIYYSIMGGSDEGGSFVECLDEEGDEITDVALADAMNDAMDAGAQIISVSSLQTPGPELYAAQIRAIREGVIVVGGLTNTNDINWSAEWPGTANGSVAVQAADANAAIPIDGGFSTGNKATTVIAPGVDVVVQGSEGTWEQQRLGTGTSYATPIVAGFLALVAQKYPDATGNQLIQSLIRNTGGENHEPIYDPTGEIGYGLVSATAMLETDPAQYPDENPLITDAAGRIPTIAEIASGHEAGQTAEPEDPSVDPAPESSPAVPVGLVVGIAVGVLVLAAVIVTVVVLTVRRSKKTKSE
jgi:subtilisin family serine protease